MKNKELRKLRRAELLELMLQQQTEIDRLKQENEQLIQKLNDRTITIENAGSIAEASLKLNKVLMIILRVLSPKVTARQMQKEKGKNET